MKVLFFFPLKKAFLASEQSIICIIDHKEKQENVCAQKCIFAKKNYVYLFILSHPVYVNVF